MRTQLSYLLNPFLLATAVTNEISSFLYINQFSSISTSFWRYPLKSVRRKALGWISYFTQWSNSKIDFFYRRVISPFAVKLFLLLFSYHCSTDNIGFSDSGYVIKPPQPSSAIYGAPPFTWNPFYTHSIWISLLDTGQVCLKTNSICWFRASLDCFCQTTALPLSYYFHWLYFCWATICITVRLPLKSAAVIILTVDILLLIYPSLHKLQTEIYPWQIIEEVNIIHQPIAMAITMIWRQNLMKIQWFHLS